MGPAMGIYEDILGRILEHRLLLRSYEAREKRMDIGMAHRMRKSVKALIYSRDIRCWCSILELEVSERTRRLQVSLGCLESSSCFLIFVRMGFWIFCAHCKDRSKKVSRNWSRAIIHSWTDASVHPNLH